VLYDQLMFRYKIEKFWISLSLK